MAVGALIACVRVGACVHISLLSDEFGGCDGLKRAGGLDYDYR